MEERNFQELLARRWMQGFFICVGLDSDLKKIPNHAWSEGNENDFDVANTMVDFNRQIIEATSDIVCAFKPNSAFYEAQGVPGIAALQRTFQEIRRIAPDVPAIYDGKRGDIGNTNKGYVRFAFDDLGADAMTVPPYLGGESLQPFLERPEKGIFVLCRTSNPSAGEFQDLEISGDEVPDKKMLLYEYVAHRVATKWNKNGNCGLVAGATYPNEIRKIRELVGDSMPILIPGVGAQGGDLEAAILAGMNNYRAGFLVNVSRSVIFASDGPDFAEKARQEVLRLNEIIIRTLKGGY